MKIKVIIAFFIENFIYPFITFQTDETFNNITVNISLQDIKHNGLKCVELTKQFMKNYTAFEPLIISFFFGSWKVKGIGFNAFLCFLRSSFICFNFSSNSNINKCI